MNIVVRTSDGAVSLLVDEIGDVMQMDASSYERPPANLARAAREIIRGVYKLNDKLLLVIDEERTADPVAGRTT
jgi:purine-binding chemotaxis protein CheW